MRVHHVGYAVKNIEKAKQQFEMLGYKSKGNVTKDEYRNIQILFMVNGNECIELVSPLPGDNPVQSIIKKSGSTPYHICYEVKDLQKTIEDMQKWGGGGSASQNHKRHQQFRAGMLRFC